MNRLPCVVMVVALTVAPLHAAVDTGLSSAAARAGVSAELTTTLAAWVDQTRALRRKPTDDAVCAAWQEAETLARGLGAVVRDGHAAAKDKAGYVRNVQRLVQQLPGISIEVRGTGADVAVAPGVDANALARLTSKNARASRVLKASAPFLKEWWPVFMKPSRGVVGCVDLSRARAPLNALKSAWVRAPACLKAAMASSLQERLGRAAYSTCFCRDKRHALKSARQVMPALQALVELDGRALAISAQRGPSDEKATFKSACR